MSEPISLLASGSPAPDECELPGPEGQEVSLGETHDPSWQRRGVRRLDRFPVAGTRPIALRFLQAEGQSLGPWVLADILDISQGGLCLLITSSLELLPSQPLELDLRSHPGFPWTRVEVEARWWIGTEGFATLGVAFDSQLQEIPRLEVERRGQPRDPNKAPWASA
jgi:hypothetical protein